DQRDQAGDEDNLVEGMTGERLAGVGKISDQLESNDCADAGARAAESKNGGDRATGVKIRRQNVGDRGKSAVAKRGKAKEGGDRHQLGGENCGDEQRHAYAAKNHHGFAGSTERPSALDEVTGSPAAKKVAQIGSEKRNPEREEACFDGNSLRDQVQGKPVGDE